ncbi:MAG: hypothetical protein JSS66_02970 [Armatimonadetes bacterium]|nr:hypothetical protein [Armatimonadota bacterium]
MMRARTAAPSQVVEIGEVAPQTERRGIVHNRLMKPLLFLAFALASACALTDDGWMPMNGTVTSWNSKHPSVRMASEVVRATVHKSYASVQCDFVFRNDGKACDVTMGFPAGGEQDWELEDKQLDKHILKGFASTVDGKKIKTRHVVLQDNEASKAVFDIRQWELKTVHFGAGQTLRVRDTYRTDLGVTSVISGMQHFYYVLATGGTWKDKMDRADVIVTFAPDAYQGKLRFESDASLKKTPDEVLPVGEPEFWKKNPGLVLWSGPSTPAVNGRTLTFTKTDYSPGKDDVVTLTFVFRH